MNCSGIGSAGAVPGHSAARLLLQRHFRPRRLARLVLHNVTRHGARSHRVGTGQIHEPRPAAPGKVAVLRADHHLIGSRGNAWTRVDARAAARLDHDCTRVLENVEITLAYAVIARLLRAKLNIELA